MIRFHATSNLSLLSFCIVLAMTVTQVQTIAAAVITALLSVASFAKQRSASLH